MRLHNYTVALQHYLKSAKNNQPEAFLNIAHIHYYGLGKQKDYLEAYKYYQSASNYNLPQADYHLGLMNQNGHGTSVDMDQAKEFFQRSANQGNQDARIALDNLPIKEPEEIDYLATNDPY